MRPRSATIVATLALAVVVVGPVPASAVARSKAAAIRLPDTPFAVSGEADGSVRTITASLGTGREPTELTTFDARGRSGPNRVLVPPTEVGFADLPVALSTVDALAAYRPLGRRSHEVLVAALPRSAGAVTTTPVSTPGRIASRPQLVAGGSAAGVLFRERAPGQTPQMMWAYRPPGETAFRAPIVVDDTDVQPHSSFFLALGPDGSGAVVKIPVLERHPRAASAPVVVRRLNADGTLGPWLTLGLSASLGDAQLAVAPDGTVAIGLSLIVPNAANPKGPRDGVFAVASLLPGAATPSKPQLLSENPAADRYAVFDYSVAAASADSVLVASNPHTQHEITVLEGAADALTVQRRFSRHGAISPLVTFTRDGGATVVWSSFIGVHPTKIVAVHRARSGRYSAPRQIAKPRLPESRDRLDSEVFPEQLVPLRGGNAALTYIDSGMRRYDDYLVTIRP